MRKQQVMFPDNYSAYEIHDRIKSTSVCVFEVVLHLPTAPKDTSGHLGLGDNPFLGTGAVTDTRGLPV